MRVLFIKKSKIIVFIVSAMLLFIFSVTAITTRVVYSMNPSEKKDGVMVPIIMYHGILKDKRKTSEYIITPEAIENDFAYLKQNGYQTILIKDLVDYVYKDKALPQKPVIITFDDGYLNNLTYALPLLEKYNFKAVISVVGSFTEKSSETNDKNPNYAYVTWEDIGICLNSGRIEIGNHTYNMHSIKTRKGCKKLRKESSEEYKEVMSNDLSELQKSLKEKCDFEPQVFTYPYGFISNESIPIIKELGFSSSLSCNEKINIITKDKNCLYRLGRFNRHGRMSTEKFMRKIAY